MAFLFNFDLCCTWIVNQALIFVVSYLIKKLEMREKSCKINGVHLNYINLLIF